MKLMTSVKRSLLKAQFKAKELLVRDEGPTMVEYGLLVAVIAVVVVIAATVLGSNISTLFGNVASSV